MNNTKKIYGKVLKVIFWKAKDTKWIIFTAAFIITMISMLFAVGESIEQSFLEAIYNTSQYDVNVEKLEYEEAARYIDDLKEENQVSYAALTTEDFVLSIPDSFFYISCIGIEGDYEEIYHFDIVEGTYPHNANEIVLDSKFSQISEKKYGIGDEVSFEIYSGTEEKYEIISYTISGFFDISHSGEYDLYGFVSIAGGDKALLHVGEENGYNILLKAKEETMSGIEQLVEKAASFGSENLIINMIRYEMISEKESDSNSFIGAFKGLAIFVGLVSLTLLFNMFQVATINKIHQLGVLRSLGMNKKQLAKAMLLSLCLYLVCSMVLGFVMFWLTEKIFGKILMHIFMDSFTQSLQYVDVRWHFNIEAFTGCALLILAIMGVVYTSILVKVMRLTPLEAVYYGEEQSEKRNAKKHLRKKESSIAFVGRRNLSRNRLQTMYTGFTLGIMSILFVTLTTILGNVDLYDIDAVRKSNLFDYEFYEDIIIASIDGEIVREISESDAVESVCAARRMVYEFFQEEEAVINSDTVVETRVYGAEVFARICKENNIPYESNNNEAVFLLLADGVITKDTWVLYDKEQKEYKIEINAFIEKDNYCESKPIGKAICLIMNDAAATELLGTYDYNVLLVNTNQKAECLKLVQKTLERNGIQVYYDDLKANTEDARAQLCSIVFIAGYILVCFGVMVVTNIICNININVNLRTKEYGMLLAMGMSRKQIIRLLIFEIMYVMEKALLFSIPSGLMISAFFINGLGQEINLMKMLILSIAGGVFLYLVTYCICYFKGKHKLSKNIICLVWDE